MTNNDVLRRLRFAFDFDDSTMMALFAAADFPVTRAQVSDWLKREGDAEYSRCDDRTLAIFLNGLINQKRGKREGAQPEPEKRLNNNLILRKLKIALNMKDDDLLDILALAQQSTSKHELSAFFRRPDHKHYRECQDQILRGFIKGLQLNYRPDDPPNS